MYSNSYWALLAQDMSDVACVSHTIGADQPTKQSNEFELRNGELSQDVLTDVWGREKPHSFSDAQHRMATQQAIEAETTH